MLIPQELFYSEAHIWLKKVENGLLMGITDFAQSALGDLQYLDLPSVGAQLNKGVCCGSAETSKSVSELFAPLDAVVEEVNPTLDDSPVTVNDSPYEDGWLLRITGYNEDDLHTLLDAQAYAEHVDRA